jgi:hypothetical protein
VCGQEATKDALSPSAQQRRGFMVRPLGDDIIQDALRGNVHTAPPDAAAFRLDFPLWLASWSERDRRLIADLMRGERPGDVARKFHLSPGRVSQLRRQFRDDWQIYCGDEGDHTDGREVA